MIPAASVPSAVRNASAGVGTTPTTCTVSVGFTAQQFVEVEQLPALAFPAHPGVFHLIENTVAVEMIKRPGAGVAVFAIQVFDQTGAQRDVVIFVVEALAGIRRIGEQGKKQMGVAIADVADLQGSNQVANLLFADQQGGNGHHGYAVVGNAFGEIELGQRPRGNQKSYQLIDDFQRSFAGGK